jgi:glycosyltransferase involved in cell wall biosynthesis
MISLITCSINEQYVQVLKENVNKYIGVTHEWLVWDNKEANRGICSVYNEMADNASYPYLCFLHEDVLIETPLWGNFLIDICEKNREIGLIGVAGGKYKSHMFSGWYSGGERLDYYSIIHRVDGKDERMYKPRNWEKEDVEVAVIDGVFMFCTKTSWETTRFNDNLLKGFHCYDIDFSLRVALVHKVVVTNRLELIHFTRGGDFGDKWINDTILFHNAMKDLLPFCVLENVQKDIDMLVARYWLDWLKNMNISMDNRVRWIRLQRLYKYHVLWYSILKFLLYRLLGLQTIHKMFKSKKMISD